jgi:hypothetical protein
MDLVTEAVEDIDRMNRLIEVRMVGNWCERKNHNLAREPQRKSNGLEYGPFVLNSQHSAPLQ